MRADSTLDASAGCRYQLKLWRGLVDRLDVGFELLVAFVDRVGVAA
jgi:hypothetical protein